MNNPARIPPGARFSSLVLGGMALAGVAAVLFATQWGAGISPGSTRYVGAARSLLAGQGVSVLSGDGSAVPLTKWPPLFPIMLAAVGAVGSDPLEAARWVNALFFGGNVLLVGLAVRRASGSALLHAALASLLMLVSVDMLYIHAMAWAEPSFIFFGLLGLSMVARHLEKPRWPVLLLAGASLGAAFLDRYAGASNVATAVVALLLWDKRAGVRKIADAGVLAFVATAPMAVWLARNLATTGDATSRAFGFRPLLAGQVPLILDVLCGWLAPVDAPAALRMGVLALSACLIVWLWWRGRLVPRTTDGTDRTVGVLVLSVLAYAAFLALSISFLDPPPTPVDFRLLGVLYPSTVVVAVSLGYRAAGAGSGVRSRGAVLTGAALLLVVVGAGRALPWLAERHADGLGYASQAWVQSETIQLVRSLPAGTRIFSNASDAVYILTGRPGYPIPPKSSVETGIINEGFAGQMATVEAVMKRYSEVLVYLRPANWRWNLPSEGELVGMLGLTLVVEGGDGAIY